jgi:DNA-binding NarL/FixJ family response regulator
MSKAFWESGPVPKPLISVFIIASNRLLRETLAKLLVRKGEFMVSGAAPFGAEAHFLIGASGADVLILDAVSARVSECALIMQTIRQIPTIKVILIDMEDDPVLFLDCVRAGATGYLLRDASAAEVISGTRAVAEGKAICPPQLCAHLFEAISQQQQTGSQTAQANFSIGLTRRQRQIVPLIGQGLTNKEIAAALNLSEQTVKRHVHGIMRSVGVKNRLDVIDTLNGPETHSTISILEKRPQRSSSVPVR